MKTKIWAMALIVLMTVFTTIGQFSWKMSTIDLDVWTLLTNYWLWLGFFFYGISTVLLIVALKGGEISVLYPIIATSYVWVVIVSYYFFNESIGFNKLFGILTIIAGIIYIGVGSK